MVTGFESVGLKAVIDGLVGLLKKAKKRTLTAKGKTALEEAMRELLLAPADLRSAEAKIRVARAAGILSEDVELAEEWVAKHKAATKKVPARKAPAKKTSEKKAATQKTSAKKVGTKRV